MVEEPIRARLAAEDTNRLTARIKFDKYEEARQSDAWDLGTVKAWSRKRVEEAIRRRECERSGL